MILIVTSNLENSYMQCVDRSVEYFKKLPQTEYIDEDGRLENQPLVHFIFTGKMENKMYAYAVGHHKIRPIFLYTTSLFSKNDENISDISYLESVKNLIERGRIDLSSFNPSELIFCTSMHSIKRLTAFSYIVFKNYNKRFIYDNNNDNNNDSQIQEIKSYLSYLTDKDNDEN